MTGAAAARCPLPGPFETGGRGFGAIRAATSTFPNPAMADSYDSYDCLLLLLLRNGFNGVDTWLFFFATAFVRSRARTEGRAGTCNGAWCAMPPNGPNDRAPRPRFCFFFFGSFRNIQHYILWRHARTHAKKRRERKPRAQRGDERCVCVCVCECELLVRPRTGMVWLLVR